MRKQLRLLILIWLFSIFFISCSSDLLYSLFSDKTKLESHLNQVVIMAKEGGYDGIEIDYEGMKFGLQMG